jgi:hypothetical protein
VSARTVVGLSIPADETQPVAVVAVEPTLAGLRQHVGRAGAEPYLEAIPVDLARTTHMWVDEDGRMADLPSNPRASRLVGPRVLGGDAIVGDVLVLGSTPEGDEASLTVDAVAWLSRELGVEVSAK